MSTKKLQIVGKLGNNVEIDTTLEQEGQAADAKSTGDAIKMVAEQVEDAVLQKTQVLIHTWEDDN